MLGVSISSVRRLEGDRLHPEVGQDGVRYFDPAEVTALAANFASDRKPSRSTTASALSPKLPAGELAARAFERFDQRQSLAEIVIALRVEPKVVRELFHEWQVGLTQGELRRNEAALAPEESMRKADPEELDSLLRALPSGEPVRISVARFITEYVLDDVSYLEVVELGGFVTATPISIDDLAARYGVGPARVTAYGLDPAQLLWECVVTSNLVKGA